MHDSLQHPGATSLVKTLSKYYKIPNLYKEAKSISYVCQLCQENKNYRSNYGRLEGYLGTKTPFTDISADIVGPYKTKYFKTTIIEETFFLLTITDRCTRWTSVFLLKSLESSQIIKKLTIWFVNNGHPKTFLSDRGRQFTSEKFANFLGQNNIKQILTSTFNPTGNSISERINQRITFLLSISKGKGLFEAIKTINYAINNIHNRNVGYTPFELCKKRSLIDPFNREISIDFDQIYENYKKKAEKELLKRNKKRITASDYVLGDIVYKKENVTKDKLGIKWKGPYEVVRINKTKNVLWLKKDNKTLQTNIKQVRKNVGGGGCREVK